MESGVGVKKGVGVEVHTCVKLYEKLRHILRFSLNNSNTCSRNFKGKWQIVHKTSTLCTHSRTNHNPPLVSQRSILAQALE